MPLWVVSNWKSLAAGGVILLALMLGWRAHKLLIDAEKADALERAINTHLNEVERSNTTGLDLATAIVTYEAQTRDINRRVHHAERSDTTARFDAGSVHRTADRIAAGEAARASIGE